MAKLNKMRALLFSDLHESFKQLRNLESFLKQEKPEAVIFAGDFLNMGETAGFAKEFIQVLKLTASNFLWVPGNNDFGRSYHLLNSQFKSLEGRVVSQFGKKFCGVGGSPASWAGQYSGENMLDEHLIAGSIFVSHVPPPGLLNYRPVDFKIESSPTIFYKKTKSEASNLAANASSNTQKRMSDQSQKHFRNSPLVHICGHIHFQCGVAYLGETKVIKLMPLMDGYYAIMDLDNLQVEFKKFPDKNLLA